MNGIFKVENNKRPPESGQEEREQLRLDRENFIANSFGAAEIWTLCNLSRSLTWMKRGFEICLWLLHIDACTTQVNLPWYKEGKLPSATWVLHGLDSLVQSFDSSPLHELLLELTGDSTRTLRIVLHEDGTLGGALLYTFCWIPGAGMSGDGVPATLSSLWLNSRKGVLYKPSKHHQHKARQGWTNCCRAFHGNGNYAMQAPEDK